MECSFYDGVGSPEEGNKDIAVLKNPPEEDDEYLGVLRYLPLNTVFQAVELPKGQSLGNSPRKTSSIKTK